MARTQSATAKLGPAERAGLEARLRQLQSEVLTGELRGLERQRLVDLGLFEPAQPGRFFELPAPPLEPPPARSIDL